MANLAASLARSLGAASAPPVAGGGGTPPSDGGPGVVANGQLAPGPMTAGISSAGISGPVLQLNAIPMSIDLEEFKDAYSADHPRGDQEAAYRLRNLCNTIPRFGRNYDQSAFYVEDVWRNIAFGANGTTSFARHLLNKAQADIDGAELASLGGNPAQPWLPVEAVPSNWTEMVANAPEVTLDLGVDGGSGDFMLIGAADTLAWTGSAGTDIKPVEGKVDRIRLRALRVDIVRSWLDLQLLAIAGWEIEGMPGGFYSSGTEADNSGIFPLLPTALVIGADIIVEGDWSRSDRALISEHAAMGMELSLGPFPVAPAAKGALLVRPPAHLIGVISALVPYAPQATSLTPGLVLVKNEGGFLARFAVDWRLNGRADRGESGSFPVAAAKSIGLPAGASDIALKIEIMTFPHPFETWKVVAVYNYSAVPRASFRLSGTTIDTVIEELPV